MRSLKLIAAATATVAALSFGAIAAAQEAQQPQNAQDLGPAAIVINKLVSMASDTTFPVTQEELDRATEFVINKAKADGRDLTRDQALVGIGFIAGSLASYLDLQGQLNTQPEAGQPAPGGLPAPQPAPEAQAAPQAAPAQ